MNTEEIRSAIDNGKIVYYRNSDTRVFFNKKGHMCLRNKYQTLTNELQDGYNQNRIPQDEQEHFFVEGSRSEISLLRQIFVPTLKSSPYYRELSNSRPTTMEINPNQWYKKTIRRRNIKSVLLTLHILLILALCCSALYLLYLLISS